MNPSPVMAPWDAPVPGVPDGAMADRIGAMRRGDGGAIWVYGRNRYAAAVAAVFPVAGFIDDFTGDREWNGLPVVPLAGLPPGVGVVSCVVGAWPVTARRRLRGQGVAWMVDYFRLAQCGVPGLPEVHYLEGAREDLAANADAYRWLESALDDDASRDVLRRLTRFRCLADLDAMEPFEHRVGEQYFPDFLRLPAGAVLVDGGAFDGDTAQAFHGRFPDHGALHCFEPLPELAPVALRRLAGVPGVHWKSVGLSDRPSRVAFTTDQGPGNRIDPEGRVWVDLDCLNTLVPGRVDYLKLDVEGAEEDALAGADQLIRRERPVLAVCVYHRQRDFHRIPRRVLGIEGGYRIRLRHYTEGFVESVMYFLPE